MVISLLWEQFTASKPGASMNDKCFNVQGGSRSKLETTAAPAIAFQKSIQLSIPPIGEPPAENICKCSFGADVSSSRTSRTGQLCQYGAMGLSRDINILMKAESERGADNDLGLNCVSTHQ